MSITCKTLGYHKSCTFAMLEKFFGYADASVDNTSAYSLSLQRTIVILKLLYPLGDLLDES